MYPVKTVLPFQLEPRQGKGSTLEYVHQDHLGGTVATSDSSGSMKSTTAYFPFGSTRLSSGTQKCIGAPPGLAPLTFGARALEALKARKTKVANWYLDLTLLGAYWGGERAYHHTAPISMIYSLREALRLVVEEGLENRWARHRKAAKAFRAGLDAIGVKCHVNEPNYVPSLTTVCIPPGVDDAATRKALLNEHNIEIGGGLGPLKGKVWRVGLMGYNAKSGAIFSLLEALDRVLPKQGFKVAAGASLAAAERVFAS